VSDAALDQPDQARSDRALVSTGLGARVRAHELALSIGLVAVVALVLGLIRLGTPSLWVDEGYAAEAAHRSVWWWFANDQYHVLYDSVIRLWTTVAGTSEWALRLPSVLGAMLACGLLVVLGRELFDRWVAVFAGLFLATSPFFVQWSQQARGYTLLVALALGATLLLLRALDRGTRAAWAAYGVAVSAVVVWHAVAGLLLVPAHLVLIAERRKRVLPHAPLAAVIFCAVAVPWAATIAMRSTGQNVGMNWLRAPTPAVVVHGVLDVSGAAGLGLALAVLGLVMLARARSKDDAVWLGVWAFAPFVLALLPSFVRPIFLDRYLIVAAPAFALLAAVAVTGIGRRFGSLALAAAFAATTLGLVAWYSTASRGNWHGENWRAAVATVERRAAPGDQIVVADWSAAPVAEYYGAPARDTSSAPRTWVLRWSERGSALTARERTALGFGRSRLVESIPFGRRLSVQLWARG